MEENSTKKTKLNELIDFVELNLNKLIDLYVKKSAATADASPLVHEKKHEVMPFLQSFFDWLLSYLTSSYQPINCDICRIIPQVISHNVIDKFPIPW